MSAAAARKPVGGVPGAEDVTQQVLRERYRDSVDPSVDAPAGDRGGAPAGPSAGAPADVSADARADARAYGIAHVPTGEPVGTSDGAAPVGEGKESDPAVSPPPGGSQTPRRVLEVKARAYKGGLRRLEPRAEALAEAIRAVLASGGTPGEVRRLLAEIGLTPDETPPAAKEALRKR